MSIVLAHLSDTHFDGGERSGARGQQVMDYLNGLPRHLDAIVVTGDVTDHGLPAEWAQADKVLTSAIPLYQGPGNHDGYTPYDGPRNQAADIGAVRLLMADSVLQGQDAGLLAPRTLDWLATELAAATMPVLIGLHHPPVDLHQPFVDELKLSNSADLADLISAYPQVLAVLCGHAHSAAATTFAGRPLLVAPGVVSTLVLPWETGQEMTIKNSIDRALPPGLAFHVIDDDLRITTHFRTTWDFLSG